MYIVSWCILYLLTLISEFPPTMSQADPPDPLPTAEARSPAAPLRRSFESAAVWSNRGRLRPPPSHVGRLRVLTPLKGWDHYLHIYERHSLLDGATYFIAKWSEIEENPPKKVMFVTYYIIILYNYTYYDNVRMPSLLIYKRMHERQVWPQAEQNRLHSGADSLWFLMVFSWVNDARNGKWRHEIILAVFVCIDKIEQLIVGCFYLYRVTQTSMLAPSISYSCSLSPSNLHWWNAIWSNSPSAMSILSSNNPPLQNEAIYIPQGSQGFLVWGCLLNLSLRDAVWLYLAQVAHDLHFDVTSSRALRPYNDGAMRYEGNRQRWNDNNDWTERVSRYIPVYPGIPQPGSWFLAIDLMII